MKHTMLDIETFSTQPNAVVHQIGVCDFDLDDLSPTTKKHLIFIDPTSQIIAGRHMEPKTVEWWQTQDYVNPTIDSTIYDIETALCILADWVSDQKYIWANSPQFDCIILEDLFREHDILCPWEHHQLRDYRTVRQLWIDKGGDKATLVSGNHNAMYDAEAQAGNLKRFYRDLLG